MIVYFVIFHIFSCFGEILDKNLQECKIYAIKEYEILMYKCSSIDIFKKICDLLYLKKSSLILTITHSNLSEVPSCICAQKRIIHLDLSFNQILKIPIECFQNKQELVYLNFDNNELSEINDKTFDGMKNLKNLSCANNKINYIGSNVFADVSDLSKLVNINLRNNMLTSLDVWPILRATYVNNTYIDLKLNQISKFTNELNLTFNCSLENYFNFNLLLTDIKITKFNSIINAYFGKDINLMCFNKYFSTELYREYYFLATHLYCDCIYYQNIKFFIDRQTKLLDNLFCTGPEELFRRKLATLSLEELICDVSKESKCPAECVCKKQPYNSTIHVLCSSKQLTKLPLMLPSTQMPTKTSAQYKLDFQNNSIENLDPRKYFNETSWLDLSESKIKNLINETWILLKDIKQIYLHNNKISMLPKIILEESGEFEKLSLFNNPIACNCENIWFRDWLKNKRDKIYRLESIICDTPYWLKGKSIIHINDEEFCTDPYLQKDKKITYIIVFTIFGIFILIIIFWALVYIYRVQVNAIFNIHPFDRDECKGEEMMYDAFISCSDQNSDTAIEIKDSLESHGYVICYQERDFSLDKPLLENIDFAITKSRRTICLISKDFINNWQCMHEFDKVLFRNISMKCNRLILILLESAEVLFFTEKQTSLEQFIKSHTYLNYNAIKHNNYQRLLYSMPLIH